MHRRINLLFWIVVLLGPAVLYYKSFTNFFFSDDFFHMVLTRQQSILGAFNIFKPAALDFYLYRPFGTQLFWWIGNSLFGLNPLGYHIIYYLFFAINIVLVWALTKSKIATFIYAFAASHFYRLFFLSTFQETVMATFSLLCLYLYSRKYWLSLLCFVVALTCKETAVVIPAVLFVGEILEKKKIKKIIPFVIIAVIYFIAHKYLYGFFPPSYSDVKYVFSFIPTINNYFWYFLWTVGLPEHYVSVRFFRGPTLINPQLFTGFGSLAPLILLNFFIFIISVFIASVLYIRRRCKIEPVIFGIAVFLIFILPVGFFPFHKFALSLSLPLFGFVLAIGKVLEKTSRLIILIIIISYLLLSFLTLEYNLETHWNVTRARIAEQVFKMQKVSTRDLREIDLSLSGNYGREIFNDYQKN